MVTRLHEGCGGHLALDFVNVVDRTRDVAPPERLLSYDDLLRWCVEACALGEPCAEGLRSEAAGDPRGAADALQRAIDLREAIFEVFDGIANAEPAREDALIRINAELARALPALRVTTTDDGFRWEWTEDEPALDAPLWPIVKAAAELLVSPGRERVRQCASARCLWLFLDKTKNRGRRWCDMRTCGNREKVRQHRLRRSDRTDASAN